MQQPKQYYDKIKLRKKAIGDERRRNMTKMILEKGTPFPKPVEFQDIDRAFEEWAKSLGMTFEGKQLPIFKLYSNQRIGEYAQSWSQLDEIGNLLMNFLCITRENNVEHGSGQGSNYNIPGNRKYPMFLTPRLQENGEEAYEMYSMKQPYNVDFTYKLTLITNKYELLNKMGEKIHFEFKAIDCYIAPNGHYMPLTLESVSDESENTIDDRKYYSQTYNIKLKGYIIRKEDYEVDLLPSRLVMRMLGIDSKKASKTTVKVEENELCKPCCAYQGEDDDRYKQREVKLIINMDLCDFKTEFEIDTTFTVTSITTNNVVDFVLKVNEEIQTFEDEVNIYNGDKISVEVERDDVRGYATVTLIGYDDEVIDTLEDAESILDETPSELDIIFNSDEHDTK